MRRSAFYIATIFGILAFVVAPCSLNAAYTEPGSAAPYITNPVIPGPPATTTMQVKILEELNKHALHYKEMSSILERTAAAQATLAAQTAEHQVRLNELNEKNNRGGVLQTATNDVTMNNQAPQSVAYYEMQGNLIELNADTQGGRMWNDVVSGCLENHQASTTSVAGTEKWYKDLVTLACSGQALSSQWGQMAGCGGGGGKYAGTFGNMAKWQSVQNIKADPGTQDMKAVCANVLLISADAGSLPTGERLHSPSKFEEKNQDDLFVEASLTAGFTPEELSNPIIKASYAEFIRQGLMGQANRMTASCFANMTSGEASFKDGDLGMDYNPLRARCQAEGRACGEAGRMTGNGAILGSLMTNRRTAMGLPGEAGSNASNGTATMATLQGNSMAGRGRMATPRTGNCDFQAINRSIQTAALYYNSPKFVAELVTGKVANYVKDNQQVVDIFENKMKRRFAEIVQKHREIMLTGTFSEEIGEQYDQVADLVGDFSMDVATLFPSSQHLNMAGVPILIDRYQLDRVDPDRVLLALEQMKNPAQSIAGLGEQKFDPIMVSLAQ